MRKKVFTLVGTRMVHHITCVTDAWKVLFYCFMMHVPQNRPHKVSHADKHTTTWHSHIQLVTLNEY